MDKAREQFNEFMKVDGVPVDAVNLWPTPRVVDHFDVDGERWVRRQINGVTFDHKKSLTALFNDAFGINRGN